MSVLVTHPTGNANVRGVLSGLHEAGLLQAFATTIATYEGDWLGRLSGKGFGAELKRRQYAPELRPLTHRYPFHELIRLLATRAGLSGLTAQERGAFCTDQIYRKLDRESAKLLRKLAHSGLDAAYCYEDGAVETFQSAKELGLRRMYDLPIGYWRAARTIQTEEAQRQPDWAGTMPALRDSDAKLERKDIELQQADAIFVASQFTASTLQEAPFSLPAPKIIPYGCPPVSHEAPLEKTTAGEKLKVLFVGSLSQRKGLSYLLEAVAQVESAVDLTLIGHRIGECAPLDAALQRYEWIESLPHPYILEMMRSHDVLVFPSLFEGFGLVLTEALSQGLPIIATAHTCAPDLIEDGKEGFIVPIRDSAAIAEKLERLANDRGMLAQMSHCALQTAAASGWEHYQRQVGIEVAHFLKKHE